MKNKLDYSLGGGTNLATRKSLEILMGVELSYKPHKYGFLNIRSVLRRVLVIRSTIGIFVLIEY